MCESSNEWTSNQMDFEWQINCMSPKRDFWNGKTTSKHFGYQTILYLLNTWNYRGPFNVEYISIIILNKCISIFVTKKSIVQMK